MVVSMCQETSFPPNCTLQLSNLATHIHACHAHARTPDKHTMTTCHVWTFRLLPFNLKGMERAANQLIPWEGSCCKPGARIGPAAPSTQPAKWKFLREHTLGGGFLHLGSSAAFHYFLSVNLSTQQWVRYYKCTECCALQYCSEFNYTIYSSLPKNQICPKSCIKP